MSKMLQILVRILCAKDLCVVQGFVPFCLLFLQELVCSFALHVKWFFSLRSSTSSPPAKHVTRSPHPIVPDMASMCFTAGEGNNLRQGIHASEDCHFGGVFP